METTAIATTLEPAAQAAKNTQGFGGSIGILLIYAIIIAGFYFLFMRPQNKRRKEETKMRENVQVGDQIVTMGGICGKVIALKDDSIVIETGADKTKMTVKRWAVQFNETVHDV